LGVVGAVAADESFMPLELPPEGVIAPAGTGGEDARDVLHREPRRGILHVHPYARRKFSGRLMLGIRRVVPAHLDVGELVAVSRAERVALLEAHVAGDRAERGLARIDAAHRKARG